ncbi:MAG: hypothetical protein WBN68_22895, partial [Sedimenticolaceae bacterium]
MIDSLMANLDRRLDAGEPPLSTFKATVRDARALLATRFEQGTRASVLVRTAARFTDAVMQRVWPRFLPADAGASLIAVGGYGRGELYAQLGEATGPT